MRQYNNYRAVRGWEGIYQVTTKGILIDLRSDREVLPTLEDDGVRYQYLTNNRGQTERLTVKQLILLRADKRYTTIGQSAAKGVASRHEVYRSQASALQERDNRIKELEKELVRLRRYFSE